MSINIQNETPAIAQEINRNMRVTAGVALVQGGIGAACFISPNSNNKTIGLAFLSVAVNNLVICGKILTRSIPYVQTDRYGQLYVMEENRRYFLPIALTGGAVACAAASLFSATITAPVAAASMAIGGLVTYGLTEYIR